MATSKMTMTTTPLRALRVPGRVDVGTFRRSTRLAAAEKYKITVMLKGKKIGEFDCGSDEYILETGEEAGIDLPYSCRAGACSSCAGLVVSGKLDDSESDFLTDNQRAAGFVLTCVAYPEADTTFETEVEEMMPPN